MPLGGTVHPQDGTVSQRVLGPRPARGLWRRDRTPPAEHPGEPTVLDFTGQLVHRPLAASGQVERGRVLVVGVHHGECDVDVVGIHSFGPELPAERGRPKMAPTLAGFDPISGERSVVDETGRLEPIQHRLRHRVGHLLGDQRLLKLVPGSSLGRELAQHDGACGAFWIGVRPGIPIILGVVPGRCRLFRRRGGFTRSR